MNTETNAPQEAELALHDFVSGVGTRPASASTAEVDALLGLRSRVAGLQAEPPVLEARWDHVLARAGADARAGWWTNRRALAKVAAGVFVVLSAFGAYAITAGSGQPSLVFNGQAEAPLAADGDMRRVKTQPPQAAMPTADMPGQSTATAPADEMAHSSDAGADWGNTLMREGSLTLRHKDPAEVQRKILDLLLVYGGQVLDLSRAGIGDDTVVRMQLSVPVEKYARFVAESSAQGEVIFQSESAKEAIGEIIDNEATLAEAQDYLKRLEALREAQKDRKDLSLSEFQELERQLRNARRDVQRLQAARDHLRNRTAMARLSLTVQAKAEEPPVRTMPGPFEEAWNDGLRTLERLGVFLLKALLGLLPLWIGLTVLVAWLWRRRRPRVYRFDD